MRASRGDGTVTVTLNKHDADCPAASRAVHCTEVVPDENVEPDWRVQVTSTGATPPDVIGCENATEMPYSVPDELTLVGHTMLSAGG